MNKLTILITPLLLLSCSKVSRDYDKLLSKAIILPKQSHITFLGRDTLISKYYDSHYKLVVYADSTECSSCAINKMFLWNPTIDFTKKYNNDIRLHFIFYTSNVEITRLALRANSFDYPVMLDEIGEFERLNPHLPKNKAMHTFLLDENNNVVLVGNPLHNPKIEKMFKDIVEEKLGKKE